MMLVFKFEQAQTSKSDFTVFLASREAETRDSSSPRSVEQNKKSIFQSLQRTPSPLFWPFYENLLLRIIKRMYLISALFILLEVENFLRLNFL